MKTEPTPACYELLETGYSSRMPEMLGLYLMACNETDYEPSHVAITRMHDGKLWAHTPDNAAGSRWHLDLYHGNLTHPVWKHLA